ncbi:MAG TPA: helix-turn-helix transcriptional regulator [Kiloniellaceae bacterium]
MVDFQDNKQEFFMKNLLPEQCRAARGLLNWTQERLAALAGVSRSTVRDFENGRHQLHRATEALLVDALGRAGIRLVSDQREVGIKLRR